MSIMSLFKKKDPTPAKPAVVQKLRPLPFTVDGANLRYAYDMEITPTSPGSIAAALGNAEKIVEVSVDSGAVSLSYGGKPFGTTSDGQKLRMVQDYLKRGDPVNAVLRENGTVSLRFYRDMRKGAENNRQTVVTLTACKSKNRQEALYPMQKGQELGCFGSDDLFICDYFGQGSAVIGKLPAKEKKMADEGKIRAIYLEDILEDGDKLIPVVRIYWSDKE